MGTFAVSVFEPAVEPGEAVSHSGRVRVLLGAALAPVATGYLLIVGVLLLVTLLEPKADVSVTGVLAAAFAVWPAIYQVPLDIADAPLGVLPLLPTVVICVVVFRVAATAVRRLGDAGPSGVLPVVSVVVGAHAVLALLVAVFTADSVVEGHLPAAIVSPPALAGIAALLGASSALAAAGGYASWSERFDPVAVRGARIGLRAFGLLLAAGLATALVATLVSASRFGELLSAYTPEVGSAVGMVLLSLGYLPNAAVLASSVLTGAGFELGKVSISAFSHTPGPVPALPPLAGLPESYGAWWPVLLLVSVAVGVGVGWALRDVNGVAARLRAVLVAGVLCGFCAVVVGAAAGGELGGGPYGRVGVNIEVFSLTAFAVIAVPGALVTWWSGSRNGPRRGGSSGRRGSSARTPRRRGR